MTAWPPELPDPFDPKRAAALKKSEEIWSELAQEAIARGDNEKSAEHFRVRFDLLKNEVRKLLVGDEEALEYVITAMIGGGHVLLNGVAGLGKTVLARSIATALSLNFQRVQFSPDLLPTDLVGTRLLAAGGVGPANPPFEFLPGPIFCNLLLVDQINSAPPKTQAALFEAMQERSVTVSGQTRLLPEPFFVIAAENPLEQALYPLSQAQLDRFFFSLPLEEPSLDEFETILERTSELTTPSVEPAFPGEDLALMRDFARGVEVSSEVRREVAELIMSTHPQDGSAGPLAKKCIVCGASPRAGHALIMAAKIRALRMGRFHVNPEDIFTFAMVVLRHRISLTTEARKSGLSIEDVLTHSFQELRQH